MTTPAPRYSPSEAVALLEEAQCGEASAAASALQKLSLHLRTPHPVVTAAALDLLQIHPAATIPHLPSLISATPADVHAAVEAFSEILAADRTLLVPIIAALSDLRLSHAHQVQTRTTLRFALDVVDSHDLPAVVRAIARLSASSGSPAAARWAADSIRVALVQPPHRDVIVVLAHVLADVCCPGNAVGAALRAASAIGVVTWVDVVVWLHALRASSGPHAVPHRQATDAVRAAARGRLLAGNMQPVLAAIEVAAPALDGAPDAVRTFARIVADTLVDGEGVHMEEVVHFVQLVRGLVSVCPATAAGVVTELVAPRLARCIAAEAALFAIVECLSRPARQAAAASRNVKIRVAVVRHEAVETGAGGEASHWAGVFVTLRKGFLFGVDAERDRALALAREIALCADDVVVTELLAVMENSVPAGLGDDLAVGFLDVISVVNLRGLVGHDVAARLYEERINSQCPEGLIRAHRKEDPVRQMAGMPGKEDKDAEAPQSDRPEGSALQVDVGLIWDQSPTAVSVVVSCATALALAQRVPSSVRDISVGMLHVAVLVPVVCISLYQAVEDCDRDFDVLPMQSSKRLMISGNMRRTGSKELPNAILQAESQDLAKAILSFGVGMSAIVGILNTSCISLGLCQRVISSRCENRILEEEKEDQRVMWVLLERLTEFDRMLNALLLGCEVLQEAHFDNKKTKNAGRRLSEAARTGDRSNLTVALRKAELMKQFVLKRIFMLGSSSSPRRGPLPEPDIDFPQLSLSAVVCAMAAVPDEAGIEAIWDANSCAQTRDIELARIDKLLTRHLLRFMLDRSLGDVSKTPDEQDLEDDDIDPSVSIVDVPQMLGSSLDIPAANSVSTSATEDRDDIFFGEESDTDSSDDCENTSSSPIAAVSWANQRSIISSGNDDYMRSAMARTGSKRDRTRRRLDIQAADVIHSPAFVALLLDRAATYVAVARKARSTSAEEHFLSNAAAVAGMCLRCIVAVVRLIPIFSGSSTGDAPTTAVSGNVHEGEVREFMRVVGQNLAVGVPNDEKYQSERWHVPDANVSKPIATLLWISQISIDAAVAAMALEVLLVLCEFGCERINYGRHAVLSSLTTVYEYNSITLWAQDDLALLCQDTFGTWCLRRRDITGGDDHPAQQPSDQVPWVDVHSENSCKNRAMDRYRLDLFFAGMHVPRALLEGCGWVREISLLMLEGPEEMNAVKEKQAEPKTLQSEDHDTTMCEALLDAIGFRNVIEALVQLVHIGLETFAVSEAFSVEEALDVSTSPITYIQRALNLLRGILRLYHQNRESPFATSMEADVKRDDDSKFEQDFDYLIVHSAISALQLTRARLDDLHTWYANDSTDVSVLSNEAVSSLKRVVGCTEAVVEHCADITASITTQYSSLADDSAHPGGKAAAAKRKSPGFAKGKQKRAGGGVDRVSRARKAVPRLCAVCETVRREGAKLAKVIGVRARKGLVRLAPVAPNEDPTLRFGVGLDLAGQGRKDVYTGAGDTDVSDGRKGDDGAEVAGIEVDTGAGGEGEDEVFGFHARAAAGTEAQMEAETVTVHFKR